MDERGIILNNDTDNIRHSETKAKKRCILRMFKEKTHELETGKNFRGHLEQTSKMSVYK